MERVHPLMANVPDRGEDRLLVLASAGSGEREDDPSAFAARRRILGSGGGVR